YLDAFPLPNGKPLQALSAEYISSWPNYIDSDSTSLRMDDRVSANVTMFGRVQHAPSHTQIRDSGRIMSPGKEVTSSDPVTVVTTMTHWRSKISEVRVNWSRSHAGSGWIYKGYGGAIAPPKEFTPATAT